MTHQRASASPLMRCVLAVPLLSLFLMGGAQAANPPIRVIETQHFFPLSACLPLQANLRLCGRSVTVNIPDYILAGPGATLTLPPPFLPEPFTAECLSQNGTPRLILNTMGLSCQLLRCPESSETICGQKLTVQAGTLLGDKINIPVPDAILVNPSTPHNIAFQEECVYRDDQAVYQLANASQVSCNLFPCKDAELNLCNTSIPVKGGASIGAVQNITMPAPFVPDVFAVQCLGDGHTPPAYKIIDAAGVTCAVGTR